MRWVNDGRGRGILPAWTEIPFYAAVSIANLIKDFFIFFIFLKIELEIWKRKPESVLPECIFLCRLQFHNNFSIRLNVSISIFILFISILSFVIHLLYEINVISLSRIHHTFACSVYNLIHI